MSRLTLIVAFLVLSRLAIIAASIPVVSPREADDPTWTWKKRTVNGQIVENRLYLHHDDTGQWHGTLATEFGSQSIADVSRESGHLRFAVLHNTPGIGETAVRYEIAENEPKPTVTIVSPNFTHVAQLGAEMLTLTLPAIHNADAVAGALPVTPGVTTATENAPGAPKRLRSIVVACSCLTIGWDRSADNAEYEVFDGDASLGITAETTFQIRHLKPISTHTITVRTRTASSAWSAASTPIQVTTLTPVLVGLHVAGRDVPANTEFGVTSWEDCDAQTTKQTAAKGWTAVNQYRGFAPGLTHFVRLVGTAAEREVRFEVPSGYSLLINGSFYTNTATLALGPETGSTAEEHDVAFTLVPNDGTAALEFGYSVDPEITCGQYYWAMSLGRSPEGTILGALTLRRNNITGETLTPDALVITGPEHPNLFGIVSDADMGSPLGSPRRFIFARGIGWLWLDDHATGVSPGTILIKCYPPEAVPTWSVAKQTYEFTIGAKPATPFSSTAIVCNPPKNDTLSLIKNNGQPTEVSWQTTQTADHGAQTWFMLRGGTNWLRRVITTSGDTTTEDVTMGLQKTAANGETQLAEAPEHWIREYKDYGWGEPKEISETQDPTGLHLVSTYSYGTSGGSYGNLVRATKPDGTYSMYQYSDAPESLGNLIATYTRWRDVPSTAETASAQNARVQTYSYEPVHHFERDSMALQTTTVPVDGRAVMIAKTDRHCVYDGELFLGRETRRETTRAYYGPGRDDFLESFRLSYHPDELRRGRQNQLVSETRANGTKLCTVLYPGRLAKMPDSTLMFRHEYDKGGLPEWGEVKIDGYVKQISRSKCVTQWDGETFDPVYVVPGQTTLDITVIIAGYIRYIGRYLITDVVNGEPKVKYVASDRNWIDRDALGDVEKTHVAFNGSTHVEKYRFGRLVEETASDGTKTYSSYNSAGMLIMRRIESKGKISYVHYTYGLDMFKRSEKYSNSPDPNAPGETSYWYSDNCSRLVREIDPKGTATLIKYDLDKHLITWARNGVPVKIITNYADGTLHSVVFEDGSKNELTTEVRTDGTRREITDQWGPRGPFGGARASRSSRHVDWLDREK